MTKSERVPVQNVSAIVTREQGNDRIDARIILSIECPQCKDHTIQFDSTQKSVMCQGGCQTDWRLEI